MTPKLFLACFTLALCAACSETTAAARVTVAGTATIAAIQVDQYGRDAQVTQVARTGTAAALAWQAASTASAAQQTQVAVDQRALAQATAAVITQNAVETVAARDATAQAVRDRDATATAQAQIHADSVATLQHAQQATATAVVVGTQTTITLTTQQANATRAQVVNWIWFGVLVLIALAGLWMLISLVDVLARRWSVAHYGPNRNPLVVLPGGVVYNPLTGITSGEELPEELKAQLAIMGQQVLALQAQHSPHAPARPEPAKSIEWHAGPIGAKTVTVPAVSVEKPVLPRAEPAKQVEAPERNHLIFVQGQTQSEGDRDLCDMREFVERGALVGFARSVWLGHKYESGHDGTRERYERLIDICTQAQVLEASGKTNRLAVPVDQALAALGAERMG
jgi:hypothetical protein